MNDRIHLSAPLLFIIFFLMCSMLASAAEITLTWDPNSEPDLAGYRIYYGRASCVYDSHITIGKETTYTFAELPPGTYYFAVTAYNYTDQESDFSSEVSKTIPENRFPIEWNTGSDGALDLTDQIVARMLPLNKEEGLAVTNTSGTTLFYPRIPMHSGLSKSPDQEFLGLAVTNLGPRPAVVLFTVCDDSGAAVNGDGIVNPVAHLLQPGAQMQALLSDLFGNGILRTDGMGWIKIESTSADLASFFMVFNNSLTELCSSSAPIPSTSSFLLPEISDQGFTRITIGNPNTVPETLRFALFGPDGTIRTSAARDLPAHGIWTADLCSELFPDLIPESGAYVKVTSDIGVLPFEVIGRPSHDLAVLKGQNAESGSARLYSPQFVVGGLWNTALSIINLDPVPGMVTVQFIGDDHSLISETQAHVEPFGKLSIEGSQLSAADGEVVAQGYVVIVSDGIRLTGSVVFENRQDATFSAAMPLTARLHRIVVFNHISSSDFYFTGIALVNPNEQDALARVDLFGRDGTLAHTRDIDIPAGHRVAKLLTEVFPEISGEKRLSGYFRITSDLELAGCAVFGTNSLSVLSTIPPHILQ